MENPSEANDEGTTALHNSICAGHFDIVKFLVGLGCDVNAADMDGWYIFLYLCYNFCSSALLCLNSLPSVYIYCILVITGYCGIVMHETAESGSYNYVLEWS